MPRHRRMRLPMTALAVFAATTLLAPTFASADDTDAAADGLPQTTATESSGVAAPGSWLQLLRERIGGLLEVLQQQAASAGASGVDGKAGSVADGSTTARAQAPSTPVSDIPCEGGSAGPYPCENVDLLSFVPNVMLGGANGNDIWGWTDPETGSEYAIMGMGYGTAFVDVTEPTDPVVLAQLVTEAADYIPLWRDIKVYDDHAFIVSEHRSHGMQVVDLTELRDLDGPLPAELEPVAVYDGFGNAHNVAINEDTGYAYAVGSDECAAGLYMVDIQDPADPQYAGCFADDGYTHDVQCVIYEGPATDLQGHELCFASNEDTVTVVDVTDKDNPVELSRTGYDEAAYTHQGWLTPDQEWFVFGDELDEMQGTVDNTTTYIMDVSDPADPGEPVPYFHETNAIDHNLYIDGDYVWQANYAAGLRVLDYSGELGEGDLTAGHLDEVAFFEVVPHADPSEFAGAWSVYPYFESGTVIVSTLEQGLFVLRATVDRPALEQEDGDNGTSPGNGQGPPEDRPGRGNDGDRPGNGPPDDRPVNGQGSSDEEQQASAGLGSFAW